MTRNTLKFSAVNTSREGNVLLNIFISHQAFRCMRNVGNAVLKCFVEEIKIPTYFFKK